jgi:hypothetical protein
VTADESRDGGTNRQLGDEEQTSAMPAWEDPLQETTAHTFVRKWETSSSPALFVCDDGHEYVVKGVHAGRMIVNDNLVARIGKRIGAPVPEVAIVHVPSELVKTGTGVVFLHAGPKSWIALH